MKIMTTIILASALLVGNASAEKPQWRKMVLDNVHFTLSARQWVKTDSARLIVTVNATLSNSDLQKARNTIMSQLKAIADGEWHITRFSRSQASSGLENLYVIAEVRTPQANLTNVNSNAKKVSRPGITYRVQDIDFSPSQEDINNVKVAVRQAIYQKVSQEIGLLNKQYPDQKYSLHSVTFDGAGGATRAPRMMQMMQKGGSGNGGGVAVSNRVTLTALVTLSADRFEF